MPVPSRNVRFWLNVSGVWTRIDGLRSHAIRISGETIDVSDSDSAGEWREILAGGIRDLTIELAGVVRDSAGAAALLQMALARSIQTIRVTIEYSGSDVLALDAFALVSTYEIAAQHTDAGSYRATLVSAAAPISLSAAVLAGAYSAALSPEVEVITDGGLLVVDDQGREVILG